MTGLFSQHFLNNLIFLQYNIEKKEDSDAEEEDDDDDDFGGGAKKDAVPDDPVLRKNFLIKGTRKEQLSFNSPIFSLQRPKPWLRPKWPKPSKWLVTSVVYNNISRDR